jgi:hypothetical protein
MVKISWSSYYYNIKYSYFIFIYKIIRSSKLWYYFPIETAITNQLPLPAWSSTRSITYARIDYAWAGSKFVGKWLRPAVGSCLWIEQTAAILGLALTTAPGSSASLCHLTPVGDPPTNKASRRGAHGAELMNYVKIS